MIREYYFFNFFYKINIYLFYKINIYLSYKIYKLKYFFNYNYNLSLINYYIQFQFHYLIKQK